MLTTGDLDGEDKEEDTQIYAKKDAQLYGKQSDRKDKFVSIQFMKKYIHLAKAIRVSFEIFSRFKLSSKKFNEQIFMARITQGLPLKWRKK